MPRTRSGLLIAVGSAAGYGTAGSLADPLIRLGWSSAAVTLLRLGCAGVVLAVPAALALRRWHPNRAAVIRLVLYGLTATGGAQLCYFNAIRHVPVGTASLLEFTAPIWLLAWQWFRSRRRPAAALLVSAGLAIVGLVLVLRPTAGGGGVDLAGLAWGLGSAFCLCAYFLLSDDHADAPPAVVTAGAGMLVGAAGVAVVALTGLLPLQAAGTSAGTVEIAGLHLAWWLLAATLVLVPTVCSYLLGIVAVRKLGVSRASFVGLAEVIFVVLFGTLLIGQRPDALQLAGIGLVVAGIAIAQRSGAGTAQPEPEPSSPSHHPSGRIGSSA